MNAAVIYLRVSTMAQVDGGFGLHTQRLATEALAAECGATVLAMFIEVASGAKGDRPQLALALRRCRSSGATLIVSSLDRLSRDAAFAVDLLAGPVPIVFADAPDAEWPSIVADALRAEREREIASERTKAGLAAAKARGVKLGGRERFGDKSNTDSTAARAAHVAKAATRNADFGQTIADIEAENGSPMTLQAIADVLNANGDTTARGKAFTRTAVMRIKRAAERF